MTNIINIIKIIKKRNQIMKKITLLFCAIIAIAFSGWAQTSGNCGDGVNWEITGTAPEKILTISYDGIGTGVMDDYILFGAAPWYSQRADMSTLEINNGVTHIGDGAFWNCDGLTGTLLLPNTITTIGNNAFAFCDFNGKLTIPSSVTTIGDGAFNSCTDIDEIICIATIPPQLGTVVFHAVTATTIYVPCGTKTDYETEWDFLTTFTFVDLIASGTCGVSGNNLTWELCGDGTLTISGSGAMANYNGYNMPWISYKSQITKLVIEDGVTTIGEAAFSGCQSLNGNLTIPNSVIAIGSGAFFAARSFTDIKTTGNLVIGNSVKTIGMQAFTDSWFDGTLTLGDSVETIGDNAFTSDKFIGNLIIPNSVKTIKAAAFANCINFTGNLIIPNSVISIGNQAFVGCINFTGNLIIPNTLVSIGEKAFSACSGLTSLTFPVPVPTIGNNAFQNCIGLDTITSFAIIPPILGTDVFKNVPNNIPVIVSCGSIDEYKYLSSGWNYFTNYYGYMSIPTGLTITQQNTNVELTWQSIPDITTYGVYRNDTLLFITPEINCTTTFYANNDVFTVKSIKYGACESKPSNAVYANIIPVTQITGVPTTNLINTMLPLTATVYPNDATYKNIVWTVDASDTTNAIIIGNAFFSSKEGTAQIRATIVNGTNFGTDYFEVFPIDITLFAGSSVTITALSNDPTLGTTSGSGIYEIGFAATITAISNANVSFTEWDDHNTDNPRTVTATGNLTFTANFSLCDPSEFADLIIDTTNLHAQITGLQQDTILLNGIIAGLQQDTSACNQNTIALQIQIINLENDTIYLNSQITDLQQDTANLNMQITGLQQDTSACNQNTILLNNIITGLQNDTTNLNSQITGLQQDLSDCNTANAGLQSDITDLNTQISTLNIKITQLIADTVTLHGKIVFLELENGILIDSILILNDLLADCLGGSSVGEIEQSIINVYPNPTNGQLTITNYELGIKSNIISIYDISGHIVAQFLIDNSQFLIEINISHLPTGMYFLKVDKQVLKIIKA